MRALEKYHIKYATIQPDSPLGITFSTFNFQLSIFNFKERSTWNTPYKFSGKELDDETGYSYFGARYYDPNISIWLSVDPLSDLFPGYSPYNYALNNPLRLIDPNGMGPVIPPNGETTNAGEGYQATQDGKYLYGEGLRTKVWNPELDYGPGSGSSGKGGFEDYKGEPIDFGSYGSNQGNNDRGNSTWEWASAVTGGESIRKPPANCILSA